MLLHAYPCDILFYGSLANRISLLETMTSNRVVRAQNETQNQTQCREHNRKHIFRCIQSMLVTDRILNST